LHVEQVRWTPVVPAPFAGRRRAAACLSGVVERAQKPAAIEERDKMAAAPLGTNGFGNHQRCRVERDVGSEFLARAPADAISSRLLVADDAAGNVPAGAKEFII